ncbi:MAG: hypothetical protein R6X25_10855 [Candidatus Krumholzibacteriia bacterium]
MKKFVCLGVATLLMAGFVASALATTVPTTAVIFERVFNDCPTSILTTVNNYPTLISINDQKQFCGTAGFANRHAWRFSTDGTTAQEFMNTDGFAFSAQVTITGTGDGEAGIGISPWWSQLVDGMFNVRSTDGEIAVFGGRLPFYSFTAAYGVNYVKGETICLEMIYTPNNLTQINPGTIEYRIIYDSMVYSSGPLPFDEGNPAEPYGLWGILNEATAGGYTQMFIQEGADDAYLQVDWGTICFFDLGTVAASPSTWSHVKSLYR